MVETQVRLLGGGPCYGRARFALVLSGEASSGSVRSGDAWHGLFWETRDGRIRGFDSFSGAVLRPVVLGPGGEAWGNARFGTVWLGKGLETP